MSNKPHRRPSRAAVDNCIQRVEAGMAEHGWMVQGVMANPPFTYTVGFTWEFNHPEVIVFGLEPRTATVILNDLGARIRAGECFEAGRRYDDVIRPNPGKTTAPLSVRFVPVADGYVREHMKVARRVEGDVEGLQLIWPDTNGRFPWEQGFDEGLRDRQPILDIDHWRRSVTSN